MKSYKLRSVSGLLTLGSAFIFSPLITGALLLSFGCSTLPNLKTEHVVMVNRAGELIDPRTNFGKPKDGKHLLFKPYTELLDKPDPEPNNTMTVDDYFTKLFTSLEQTPLRTGGKRKRILLYVHGGLNTAQTSIERVVEYSSKIQEDGTYPIFVNWDSSLTSSYRDHLVLLRQGRRADDWCCGAWKEYGRAYAVGANVAGGVASVVTTPLYFAFDFARGVIRLPVDIYGVYADLLSSHWRSVFTDEKTGKDHWPDGNCAKNAKLGMTPRADRLLCEVQHPPTEHAPYPMVQGANKRTLAESALQAARTVATVPDPYWIWISNRHGRDRLLELDAPPHHGNVQSGPRSLGT